MIRPARDRRRTTSARLAVALAALPLAVVAPAIGDTPPAAAVGGCNGDSGFFGDVDDDGRADVVVGLPRRVERRGGVLIHDGRGEMRVLTARDFGATPLRGARLGYAVTVGDVNHDGCEDIVAGAPRGTGGGYVAGLLGTRDGAGAAPFVIPNPGGGEDDAFGAEVLMTVSAPFRGEDRPAYLWVGAPRTPVDGVARAGAVHRYRLDVVDGVVTPAYLGAVTMASDEPGPQVDARFGRVLSRYDDTDILFGVPRWDVGAAKDAGAAGLINTTERPGTPGFVDEFITRASDGVPGRPRTGDRFGAAVVRPPTGYSVAIGIPGADSDGQKNSGAVLRAHRLDRGYRLVTQDSRFRRQAVPGTSRRFDRFGAAVVFGETRFCGGRTPSVDLLVGVPGKDAIRGTWTKGSAPRVARDAGAVTVLSLDSRGSARCAHKTRRQGDGFAGRPRTGDSLGEELGVLPQGRRDGFRTPRERVLAGVPGEDVGDARNAGAVVGDGRLVRKQSYLRMGSVIATVAVPQ